MTSEAAPHTELAPRALPPMLQQYLDYKEQYPHTLLFFQVGDFYEVFFNDAVTVAKNLNLTLTSRDKSSPDPIPMCGVPIAVIDGYLERLVAAGFAVAIVSQGAAPSGKGMVPRFLDRIVTPGINILANGQPGASESIVAALSGDPEREVALSFSNVQSGVVYVREGLTGAEAVAEVSRLHVTELLLPQLLEGKKFDRRSSWIRALEQCVGGDRLRFRSFGTIGVTRTSDGRVLTEVPGFVSLASLTKSAVQLLVDYIDETTVTNRLPIVRIEPWQTDTIVAIDATTRRNLELVVNSRDGSRSGTLYEYMDRTCSLAGSRLLRRWILHPLLSCQSIMERHDAVALLVSAPDSRAEFHRMIEAIADVERIAARIELSAASPRELGSLRDALERLPLIREVLLALPSRVPFLGGIEEALVAPAHLSELLSTALVDEPPAFLNEGGIFRDGFNEELDRLRLVKQQGKSWIAAIESREREATGISSLKVKFNNVLGFFIEVTRANLSKVPESYIRRQTTTNGDRFTTVELKELEEQVLGADSKIIALEREQFEKLRAALLPFTAQMRVIGEALAALDVVCALAELAVRYDLTRPVIDDSTTLLLHDAKHPVLAALLAENFVPNSLTLREELPRCALITGPNMGGKSTYLRQTALIVVMAQCGSFVPASQAHIGIVDQIFARIGASDNLREGESTFMVEMREASHILQRATVRSLVVIDEVGRGTATTDGLAIAQAILEWLVVQSNARTLFATHFHELTDLPKIYPTIVNLSVTSIERGESVLFTHEIREGAANKSYGIEVAKLAGLPAPLLARARELLSLHTAAKPNSTAAPDRQLSIFSPPQVSPEDEVLAKLRAMGRGVEKIDINSTTPLQALELLAKYRTELLDLLFDGSP